MTRELRSRFAVVGSGAGGAVTAYLLARAGEPVVVLERGAWVRPADLRPDEPHALATLYQDGGAQLTRDLSMTVLQGRCVGGSTVVSNVVCFRMPEAVRRRFAAGGFELPAADLAAAYDVVESVLNVHEIPADRLNPAAERLEAGLRALGLEARRFRHASLDCVGCGECNLGCRFGAKLDASRTWIPMAVRRGAVVVPGVAVNRVEVERGRVVALHATDLAKGTPVRVVADRYVLAGGAIATPELLLRSGILADRAGTRASMNAGAMMVAEFPAPLDAFRGLQMGVYHETDGATIEQDHNPYLSFCLTQPVGVDRLAAARPDLYRHLTSVGVLAPTPPEGRVRLPRLRALLPRALDRAVLDARLPEVTRAAMVKAYALLARIYLAGGATRVFAPTHEVHELRRPDDVGRLDALLADPRAISGLGTAHPQGGSPIGDDDRRDVLTPEFRVRGLDNCFVVDASVFPASVEVNPLLSVMAVAYLASRHVVGRAPPAAIEEGPAHDRRRALGLGAAVG
ncbi:MAG: GMC family oxidoreductase [Planctomycetia bacterium]|nr:GMC family oxidoreductase [Planctomycetia bacterium]